MTPVHLGIDIAKASFSVARWENNRGESLDEFANTQAGFRQLVARVTQAAGVGPGDPIHVALEPTGGYELALALFLHEQGWQVSRPNPKRVRDFAKGLGRRAKTDRLDALVLAQYAAERQPSAWAPLPSEVSELESLLERQRELAQMLGQEKRRLEALSGRPGVAAGVPETIERMIESLEATLAQVEEAIRAHLKQYAKLAQEAKRLRKVPGIGERNGLALLVLMHRWHTLTGGRGEAKGLVAFVGLDPQTHESGTSVRGRGTISRMGDRRLRPRLYMGALGGVKGDNALRVFYQRLVGRGKRKKVALVAAARKIVVWAWAVFRDQSDFRSPYAAAEAAATA
jgi:transposase